MRINDRVHHFRLGFGTVVDTHHGSATLLVAWDAPVQADESWVSWAHVSGPYEGASPYGKA